MLRVLAGVCVGLALLAYQGSVAAQVRNEIAFDAKSAAFINKKGKVTIKGHAFLRRKDGQTVNAAGEVVRLIPVTAYAQERFQRLYQGKKLTNNRSAPQMEAADPVYSTMLRQTISEANGTFSFENVSAGHYYIATQLVYQHDSPYFMDGGALYTDVTISGKEEEPVKVVLSGN